MRLEHPDYITLVIEAYKKKLANNELSPLLVQSTPANVRLECANVYQERYEKKDEPALRAFFGPAEDRRRFLAAIQEFNVNRFKPLDDYFKKKGEKNITDRNVDMLAWLINFERRPYIHDNNTTLNDEELFLIGKSTDDPRKKPIISKQNEGGSSKTVKEPEDIPENGSNNKPVENPSPITPGTFSKITKWIKGSKRAIMIALILMLCCGSIYIIWQAMSEQNGCMYWNGNQYVPVSCNEDPHDRVFLPLDVKKMENFERITQKDTISWRSIGKIYYIKDNKRIEYYTYSGNYPQDLNRYVKKLTRYIFEKDSVNRKLNK